MMITADNEAELKRQLGQFISSEISRLKKEKGFTSRDIVALFDVSIAHISALSNHKGRKIALSTLFEVATVFGFSCQYTVTIKKDHREYKCMIVKEDWL